MEFVQPVDRVSNDAKTGGCRHRGQPLITGPVRIPVSRHYSVGTRGVRLMLESWVAFADEEMVRRQGAGSVSGFTYFVRSTLSGVCSRPIHSYRLETANSFQSTRTL
jgi:hypothetical protein